MLKDSSIQTGNWLFVRRGWLPLVLYVFAPVAMILDQEDIADPMDYSLWFSMLCLGISVLGIVIRALTIGYTPKNTSGRNTSVGQVADQVNTKGIYSVIRHPLYVGNFFMWFGLILYVDVDWYVIGSALLFWIYYEKIMMAEEEFLFGKFGKPYLEWTEKVNAVIPTFGKFEKAGVPFSLKNVIKREYHGLFYLVLSFIYLIGLKSFIVLGQIYVPSYWFWAGAAVLVFSVVVRILVKKTQYFNVEGR